MKIISPPSEVLTVAEVADHLRIGDSPYPDETLLEDLIIAARQWAEDYLRRAIGEQTLEDAFASFAAIRLRPPVASIDSIYYKISGVSTLLAASTYDLMDDPDKGGVRLAYGQSWPSVDPVEDAVVVRYTAGYVTGSPNTLPGPIRSAMLLVIGDLYENREAQILGTIVTENKTVERLVSTYRLEMGI
jgi:uncharacterized phiE125 gp8 family phage protein